MEKSKQISVEIKGVTYTPVYNMNSLSKFSDMHGFTVEDLTRMSHLSLRHCRDLSFFGIEEYCRIKGIKCPFEDVLGVGELDSDTISKLFQSISTNMMKLNNMQNHGRNSN